MAYQSRRHDLGITNVGTDGSGTAVVGMMLARDKNNVPKWEIHDAKLLADQFVSAIPSPEYTNPEEELLLGQSDWRSGFGLELWDSDEPRRYYSSIGADLRFRNMAVAGPIATGIAMPAPHTASTWNFPTNYIDPSGVWSNEANAYDNDTGTFATRAAAAGWSDYLYVSIPAISCTQIRYWWSEVTGDDVTDLEIDVYYNGAWNAVVTDDSQGEGAYATAALGATYTVTGARIRFQMGGAGAGQLNEIQFYGTATGIQGYPVAFAEFNDLLYIAIGNTLYKLNGTGNGFTFVAAFPAPITDLEPFSDSNLYIALGTVEPYWYMSTAEALTRSTAAANTYKFLKTVHSATPTLWGSDSDYTIRSNTNPINGGAAWSATTTVGSSYYAITGLIQKSGALYIMKEDMPYYLDSTGAVQNDLAPELQALTASTSGKNAKVWKNKIYIPCGAQSLLESGTANTFIDPSSYATNLSDFAGQVMALGYDEEWLFAAVDNSTKIEVLAGHEETIGSTTSWVWHPINEITLAGAETMFVSTVYQKRLWVSSTSSSDSLYYIPLPTGYGNITADTNRSFKTGSYFITPYLHANFRSTQKAFIKLTVTLGHAYDADIYVTGAYEKLGDTSWTTIGNFDGTSTNRVESIFIPVDASSNKPKSTMMRFKFTFVTDDTQKTPIMINYTVKAVLYPEIKKLIACTVRAANEITCKSGMVDKGMKATIDTTITNAMNATWPVTIYDIDGTSQTVKFLPLPRNTPRYTTITDEVGREQERYYNLLMMVVPLS